MKLPLNISIDRNIVYQIMLAFVALLLLASLVYIAIDMARLRRSLIDDITGQAEILSYFSAVTLISDDNSTAEKILAALTHRQSIVAACIYDKKGGVFAAYGRNKPAYKLNLPSPQEHGYRFEDKYLHLFNEIDFDDEIIGMVYIRSDLKQIEATMKQYFYTGMLVLTLAVFGGYLLSTRREKTRLEEKTETLAREIEFILGATNTGIDIIDSEYNIIYINPEWKKLYGNPTGRKCYEYFMDRIDVCPDCGVEKALETESVIVTETEMVKENYRPVQITSIPYQDKLGEWFCAQVNVDISERKRAEASLLESEAKYRAVIDQSKDCIYLVDLESLKILEANPALGMLLGYTYEEILQSSIYDIVAHKRADINQEIQRIIAEGYYRIGERHYRRKDGSIIEMDVSVYVLPIGNRKVLCVVARDITERKRAIEALRESEEKYRSLYSSMSEGVCLHEIIYSKAGKAVDYRILDVNPVFESITGMKRSDVVGKLASVAYGTGKPPHLDFYADVASTGKPFMFETFFTTMDKHLSVSAFSPGKGQFATIYTDISERKEAEKALRKSEEELKTLFERINDVVFQLSPIGIINYVSPRVKELYGYDPEELMGKHLRKITPTQEVPKALNALKDVLAGETINIFEIDQKNSKGKIIPTEVSLTPIEKDGETVGVQGVVRDVSERKRAEKELRLYREHLEVLVNERTGELEEKAIELEQANIRLQEMDRLKSIFLASMSHELRTPLNSIIGFTGIILQGLSGDVNEEQKKQLTIVKKSANHLLSLINEILDVSKIEAGKAEVVLEEFMLNEIVREVVDSITPAANIKNVKLITEMPGEIMLYSDSKRIKQVLVNLTNNAIKFTDRGSVRIKASLIEDERLRMSVEDTGVGIKEENMNKLFMPFQQIDEALTKPHEGTGLGLSVSKKLITLLGGDIWAKSEYGKGSEFTFVLPLKYKEEKRDESG